MKLYIYTMPKAGTYFIADFMGRLGFRNTGFHLSMNSFLNTQKLDNDTNARFPGRAKEIQPFTRTLRSMGDGDLAFGHFALPLLGTSYSEFSFICSYRHPRKSLVSEFIDFRFRREDIPWIAKSTIPDDRRAFCTYLKRNGPANISILSQMLAVSVLRKEEFCQGFDPSRHYMLNFERLLADPDEAGRLAVAFGATEAAGQSARLESIAAETKTKATNLGINRDALWSPKAEDLYKQLRADDYVRRGRELGWTI